eukprot:TRINITY_DN60905_c0_g1_i1.p1 TRINITY_DN60905_c0_g1~~TRINITY_DN60905_c0_g1_i1.p1  ORF type:complete len:1054 (-),score=252.25 TRINITY_DN60905_c0_g1_i1:128-3289(-)
MVFQFVISLLSIVVSQSLHLPNADSSEASSVEASVEDIRLPLASGLHVATPAVDSESLLSEPEVAVKPLRQRLPHTKNPSASHGWLTLKGTSALPPRPYASFASQKGFWSKQETELFSKVRHESTVLAAERETVKRTDASMKQRRSHLDVNSQSIQTDDLTNSELVDNNASSADLLMIRKEAVLSKKRANTAKQALASLKKKHAEMARQFEKAEANEAFVAKEEIQRSKEAVKRSHLAEVAMEKSKRLEQEAHKDKTQASGLFKRAHLVLASAEKEMKESESKSKSIISTEEHNREKVRSAESVLRKATDKAQRTEASAAGARIAYKEAQAALRRNLAKQKSQEAKAAAGLKEALAHARLMARQAREADAKSVALRKKARVLWGQAGSVLHRAQSEGLHTGPERRDEPKLRKVLTSKKRALLTADKLATSQKAHVAKAKKIVEKERQKLRELLRRHAIAAVASVQRLRKAKAKAQELSQRAEQQSKEAEKLAQQAAHQKITATALAAGKEVGGEEKRRSRRHENEDEAEKRTKSSDEEANQTGNDWEKVDAERGAEEQHLEKTHTKQSHSKNKQLGKKKAAEKGSHSKCDQRTAITMKSDLKKKNSRSSSLHERASTKDDQSVAKKGGHPRSHQGTASTKDERSATGKGNHSGSQQKTGATKDKQSRKSSSKVRQPKKHEETKACNKPTSLQEHASTKDRGREYAVNGQGKQTTDMYTALSAKWRERSSERDLTKPEKAIMERRQNRNHLSQISMEQQEARRIDDHRSSPSGGSSTDSSSINQDGDHGRASGEKSPCRIEDRCEDAVEPVSEIASNQNLVDDANSLLASVEGEKARRARASSRSLSTLAHTDSLQAEEELHQSRLDKKRSQEAREDAKQEGLSGARDVRLAKEVRKKGRQQVRQGVADAERAAREAEDAKDEIRVGAIDSLLSSAEAEKARRETHGRTDDEALSRAHRESAKDEVRGGSADMLVAKAEAAEALREIQGGTSDTMLARDVAQKAQREAESASADRLFSKAKSQEATRHLREGKAEKLLARAESVQEERLVADQG